MEGREAPFHFLKAKTASHSLQTFGTCLNYSRLLHLALLFGSCCREEGGQASQQRKQILSLFAQSY